MEELSLKAEVFQRLDALANGLKTTVDKLYDVMLQGAKAEAIFAFILFLFFVGLTILIYQALSRYTDKKTLELTDPNDDDRRIEINCDIEFASVFKYIICIILATFGLYNLKTALVAAFAPDYWVMQEILKMLS